MLYKHDAGTDDIRV